MGRATRWFKSLFTGKKLNSAASSTPERKKWGLIGKKFRQKGEPPPQPQMVTRLNEERRGSYREVMSVEEEDEQNKRAIAVAAATAAVAEAAVAAAHAAAAVVRLTSSGRWSRREEVAIVKIQSAFRGYLARRALKALRGLVKLQALVRGHIVRKQAAETLRCMHALLRVQAQARASRTGLGQRCRSERDLRVSSANSGPPTPEKSDQPSRSNGSRSDRSSPLKRNSTKSTANSRVDRDRTHSSSQRNWLDQWMDEKYYNGDKHAKILEIDSGKPIPDFSKNSPSKDSTIPQLSPNSVSSPHFYSATSLSRRSPFTPTKSECSFGGYADYPNYMANTESFSMKSRSQSAPKQRPDCEKSGKRSGVLNRSIQAKFANKAYPGSGRLDRLGMPILRH